MLIPPTPEAARGSAASETRAARRTWACSTTTGSASTTGSPTSPAALGVAQLERLDELLAARARVAGLYGERLAAVGGRRPGRATPTARASLRRSRPGAAQLVRLRRPAAGRRRPRRGDRRRSARRGIEAKAYLPVHPPDALLPRALRFAGGEFPVAERVGERSLALPFFPAMSEEQVERVCEALASARWAAHGPRRSDRPCFGHPAHRLGGSPRSQGVNSTPSSSRALVLSTRACQSRKWSWPRPSSGGRRITPRHGLAAGGEAPWPAARAACGGTRPRPRLVDGGLRRSRASSRSRRRGCSARRAARGRTRRDGRRRRRRRRRASSLPAGRAGRRPRIASRIALSRPASAQGPGP